MKGEEQEESIRESDGVTDGRTTRTEGTGRREGRMEGWVQEAQKNIRIFRCVGGAYSYYQNLLIDPCTYRRSVVLFVSLKTKDLSLELVYLFSTS